MSKLDWNNAGDHVWPCMYSLPGDYPVGKTHCTCDLPIRMIKAYLSSKLTLKETKHAREELHWRRETYQQLIEKALDE